MIESIATVAPGDTVVREFGNSSECGRVAGRELTNGTGPSREVTFPQLQLQLQLQFASFGMVSFRAYFFYRQNDVHA
jgi:hypothetical protein